MCEMIRYLCQTQSYGETEAEQGWRCHTKHSLAWGLGILKSVPTMWLSTRAIRFQGMFHPAAAAATPTEKHRCNAMRSQSGFVMLRRNKAGGIEM